MTSDLDEMMRGILGERWDSLSEEEKALAKDVAQWYDGGPNSLTADEYKIVDAIWRAAREELGERSGLLASPRRTRDLTDVRFVMFRLVRDLVPRVPQSHIPDVLGIKRDSASTIYALRKSMDLIEYEPRFRALYFRMRRHVFERAGIKNDGDAEA